MDAQCSPEPIPTSAPAARSAALGGSVETTGSLARQVTIYLIDAAESSACPFWIGLAGPGPQSASQLLDIPSTAALLHAAATQGLNEATPMMLTDTTASHLRSVLLMPPPSRHIDAREDWLRQLSIALQPWHPTSVGVYLAADHLPSHEGLDLLGTVLRQVVSQPDTAEVYLLTDSKNTHAVLNTALKIKADIPQDRISLYVFH
ncbi:MAG: hypothetical protein NTZ90_04705 [Proteobacteria bacterium]|nr:hypothetical protein [Pseudomonadota bacterium]